MKYKLILSSTLQAEFVKPELLGKVEQLDLSIIKDRMVFKHAWSEERADSAIIEYRRYLYLTAVAGVPVSPTREIDEIWHEHILHTNKYAIDCQQIFGRFLNHFPTPVKWKQEQQPVAGFCCNHQDCCNDDPIIDQLLAPGIVRSQNTTSVQMHSAECGEPISGGCVPIGGSEDYCGGTTSDAFAHAKINFDNPQQNQFLPNVPFDELVSNIFVY